MRLSAHLMKRCWALGGLLLLTISAVEAQAFRTAADLPEFEGTERVRWADAIVRYEVSRSMLGSLNAHDVANVAFDALEKWAGPECSGLHPAYFGVADETAQPGDGRNTVQFVNQGWADLGYAANAAGATDVQYERLSGKAWEIVEFDLYINSEHFRWSVQPTPPQGTRSLQTVLFHELGHAAGLLHSCEADGSGGAPRCEQNASYSASIMFPEYDPAQQELTGDDTRGICFLYPACESESCGDGKECTPEGCVERCGDDLCPLNQVCTSDGCRDRSETAVRPSGGSTGCRVDAQCGPLDHCVAGECQRGTAGLGEMCEGSEECIGGTCSKDGICVPACATDYSCPGASQCDTSGEPAEWACRDLLELGAACSQADECAGGECLAGVELEPICTRRCDEVNVPCPTGWSCETVKQRDVCTPVALGGASGCSLDGASSRGGRVPWVWVLASLGVSTISQRRLRSVLSKRKCHQ